MTNEEWGSRLRQLMKQAGITSATQLAHEMSVRKNLSRSTSVYYRYLRGAYPKARERHLLLLALLAEVGSLKTPDAADEWLAMANQPPLTTDEAGRLFGKGRSRKRSQRVKASVFRQVHAAMLLAFDELGLRELLRFELEVDLYVVSSRGPLRAMVLDVMEWAEREGRFAELVQAAARERPQRSDLSELSQQLEQQE